MFEDFNATETVETTHSGAQEGVVDSPESQTGGEESAALDDRDGAVDRQEEDGEAEDFDAGEGDAEDDAVPDGADQEEERKQTREDNAAIRAARLRAQREAEAKAKAEAAARANEKIRASGVINPYTGKPFETVDEFEDYGKKVKEANRAELAKKTGRSVAELEEEEKNQEFLSKLRREREEKAAAEQADAERRSFVETDVMNFVEKYPQFASAEKLGELENNKTFRDFCGSRYGKEPLADLYGAYLRIVGTAGNAAVMKAERKTARSTGGGPKGAETLTPEQKRSLDRWNAENPDMKMTAKEFLTRE